MCGEILAKLCFNIYIYIDLSIYFSPDLILVFPLKLEEKKREQHRPRHCATSLFQSAREHEVATRSCSSTHPALPC
jgi:hypothetical protein